jgi:hypothetical protein
VEFSNGRSDWLPLWDVKDGNPIKLAKYAITSQIDHESTFQWGVPLIMQKRDLMINKVKKKYWRTTHKYGIRIPKTVAESLQFDKENGKNYWEIAIQKEMTKELISYYPISGATPDQVTRSNQVDQLWGHQEINATSYLMLKWILRGKLGLSRGAT